jgi:hypothetical protein
MIRAWISIQTFNGRRFKYVRDVTEGDTAGDTYAVLYAPAYYYGDTIGDSYGAQGDSSQVKHNFDYITNSYLGDSNPRKFLLFPESTGDTYLIVRPNQDQLVDYQGDYTGDTGDSADIDPYIREMISVNSVQSISVIEERVSREERFGNVYIP